MTRLKPLATAATALLLTFSLAACAPQGPQYIDAGTTYDATKVTALLASVDLGELAQEPVAQIPGLRRQALADLRTRGGKAATAADLITDTFAGSNPGVPVYVETADYDGTPVVIVVEAIGRKGGELTDARVWVLSDDGDVLYSGLR